MTTPQIEISVLLVALVGVFIWGRWRHDVVAFTGLMVAVLLGLVPVDHAFSGFSHPATVTVALVLVLSRALADSGAVDLLANPVMRLVGSRRAHIAALGGTCAVLSGFMNDVGALALMMPVAMQTAARSDRSPSLLLMPLAFASLLGGMTTLIGTPPNLIVASFAGRAGGEPFHLLDFAYVGVPVALAGLAFISLVGWRLLPTDRRRAVRAEDFFKIADYLIELEIREGSPLVGRRLGAVAGELAAEDGTVLGLVRGQRRFIVPPQWLELAVGDLMLVEAAPAAIDKLTKGFGLELPEHAADAPPSLTQDEVQVIEVVVKPGGALDGRTVASLALARRYEVALLGVAREGSRIRSRVGSLALRGGDVLLLRGEGERLAEVGRLMGLLPLAGRRVQLGRRGKALPTLGVFAGAVLLAGFGLLPITIAFGVALVVMVLTGLLPVRDIHESVDWPVIVLLGGLIPVGGALETTGMAGVIGGWLGQLQTVLPAWALLGLLLLLTMLLTNVLNHAATVVVMAPIAIGLAAELHLRPEAFLMAIAIGSSAAFLSPVAHQSNTLVMAPGGYRFGDYWRMGLPLAAVVALVALPLLLIVWPLHP
jgi:di/tricarboxylate transporter